MHYKSLLTISVASIIVVGCSVTNPSSEPIEKMHSEPNAPPRVVTQAPSATSDSDVSLTYSAVNGGGTMMQASVSAPTSGNSNSVPSIPKANQAQSYATGLSVNMPYSDAWNKTAKALPSAGYPVMEKDDLTGTYYVLDKVGSGGKIERNTPIYQVRLTKSGDSGTKIILLNSDSQPASANVSNRILGALKNKLG